MKIPTTKKRLISRLQQLEDQLGLISERLYSPITTEAERKEILKKSKKIKKTKEKIYKKLKVLSVED